MEASVKASVRSLVRSLLFSAAMFSALPASAGLITSGSINAGDGGGITGFGSWDSPLTTLTWSVSELESGLFQYLYDFGVPLKDTSHIEFQVSTTFTTANVFEGTTSGWLLGTWGDSGNSDPGIPSLLYGLKFEGDGLDTSITIVSDRAPMWGSFYAKDGVDNEAGVKTDVFAYNTSFGLTSVASITGIAPFGFLAVPDTEDHITVPEPSSLAIMALAMLGAVGFQNRRKTMGSAADGR